MVVPGDDARGHVDEALAAQRRGQELAAVDAAAMQVAVPAGEAAQPLGAGGGVEDEPDAGALGVEPGHGLRQHGVDPHRDGGDAEGAAAPGAGGVEGLVGRLELVEDAPGVRGGGDAERGEAKLYELGK